MEQQAAKDLWNKYIAGNCTEEELAKVESWYNQEFADLEAPEILDYEAPKQKIWGEIRRKQAEIQEKQTQLEQRKQQRIWSRIAAAAALIIIGGLGLFFFQQQQQHPQAQPGMDGAAYEADITPGTSKAMLTLANGEKISLTDAGRGKLAQQYGISITKTADGKLTYQIAPNGPREQGKVAYNTLETPAGGEYQIVLQDGSKVWLNASSAIKFPVSFDRSNQRIVSLTGQAYFEVSKNKNKPFIVETSKQQVEVLGTHFDVNAYADENTVKTTLLEGAVRVSPAKSNPAHFTARILQPNQQSLLSGDQMDVIPVETSDVVAWKNGKFMFNNEELESIMKKVARWYDVDIRYVDEKMKKNVYWGTVSKFSKVSKVLNVLEITGDVHFKIEGKTITVMP